ncbi:MAG: MptD family putative ECF transporter S component [Desulfovibrio sp.]|nr:MptD family putative ECF transporter S component [Desulfovibrio sp.]
MKMTASAPGAPHLPVLEVPDAPAPPSALSPSAPPPSELSPSVRSGALRRAGARYWAVRELVTVGVFAALTKVSSLLVALVGGGMNPLTLMLKNLVFTVLALVLLFKLRKPGTLLLFTLVNVLVSMLLMGGGFFLLPSMLVAGLAAEGIILLLGGYRNELALVAGIACYDILFKAGSFGVSWLFVREQPELLWFTGVVVAIGYLGALAGLPVGLRFLRELRHAGIVHE